MSVIKVNSIQHAGAANASIELSSNGRVAFSNTVAFTNSLTISGNVGIANTTPIAKFQVDQNTSSSYHGYAGKFRDTSGAGANFIPFDFESVRGNHSFGIISRFRISTNDSDRPSIQFSSSFNDTRWSVGYCTGSDDNFRISQNMGYRNDGVTSDTWGTERFRITTDGYVITPSQPRFFVRRNDLTTYNGTVVIFNEVEFNVGSGYNSSTGRFTAPVSGYYFFHATGGNNTNFYWDIRKNGTIVIRAEHNTGANFHWLTACRTIYMAGGDYADVFASVGATRWDAPYAGFGGYLLG